ncbi:MAG: hypothetical protein ACOCV8_01010 [Spirochaetota bacterium]
MFDEEEKEQIREITKEEIKKMELLDYFNTESEKNILANEIRNVQSDISEYNKEMNMNSIEYRIRILEKLILNIEKVNKIILKLILALFAISLALLVSFIVFQITL